VEKYKASRKDQVSPASVNRELAFDENSDPPEDYPETKVRANEQLPRLAVRKGQVGVTAQQCC
jgi:hypothetical protein